APVQTTVLPTGPAEARPTPAPPPNVSSPPCVTETARAPPPTGPTPTRAPPTTSRAPRTSAPGPERAGTPCFPTEPPAERGWCATRRCVRRGASSTGPSRPAAPPTGRARCVTLRSPPARGPTAPRRRRAATETHAPATTAARRAGRAEVRRTP